MNDTFITATDTDATATSTDAETVQALTDINNNLTNIYYSITLFIMLWTVLMCKKIIHNAIRNYMDIRNK